MKILKRVIAPIGVTIFLGALFYPLCVENDVCDYMKLWVLIGIPFGIHRMFLWVIPKGYDLGGTVGILAMNLLVGGIIGGIILSWRLIQAVFYLIKLIMEGGVQLIKMCTARW